MAHVVQRALDARPSVSIGCHRETDAPVEVKSFASRAFGGIAARIPTTVKDAGRALSLRPRNCQRAR